MQRVMILRAYTYTRKTGDKGTVSRIDFAVPRTDGPGLEPAGCNVAPAIVQRLQGICPCVADVEVGMGSVFDGRASMQIVGMRDAVPLTVDFDATKPLKPVTKPA